MTGVSRSAISFAPARTTSRPDTERPPPRSPTIQTSGDPDLRQSLPAYATRSARIPAPAAERKRRSPQATAFHPLRETASEIPPRRASRFRYSAMPPAAPRVRALSDQFSECYLEQDLQTNVLRYAQWPHARRHAILYPALGRSAPVSFRYDGNSGAQCTALPNSAGNRSCPMARKAVR